MKKVIIIIIHKLFFLDRKIKGAFKSVNPIVEISRIEQKIKEQLKRNQKIYGEKYKDKEYLKSLLFPSYNIDLLFNKKKENNNDIKSQIKNNNRPRFYSCKKNSKVKITKMTPIISMCDTTINIK